MSEQALPFLPLPTSALFCSVSYDTTSPPIKSETRNHTGFSSPCKIRLTCAHFCPWPPYPPRPGCCLSSRAWTPPAAFVNSRPMSTHSLRDCKSDHLKVQLRTKGDWTEGISKAQSKCDGDYEGLREPRELADGLWGADGAQCCNWGSGVGPRQLSCAWDCFWRSQNWQWGRLEEGGLLLL